MDKKLTLNEAMEYIERWSVDVDALLSHCITETAKARKRKGLPYPENETFQSIIFPRKALNKLQHTLPNLNLIAGKIRQALQERHRHE